MDYLEGFFIGPVWSDTEYQTRSHKALYVLLSAAIGALYVFLLFFPTWRHLVLVVRLEVSAIALLLLVLLTPFISCFYYRVPVYIRPLLLLFYLAKYVLAVMTLLHLVLPLWQPDVTEISAYFVDTINKRINLTTAKLEGLGPLFGMIGGIVLGGLWSVGEVLLVILILIFAPLFLILALKGLRYLMDKVIASIVFTTSNRR